MKKTLVAMAILTFSLGVSANEAIKQPNLNRQNIAEIRIQKEQAFEKRLGLTEEQKNKAKEIRIQGHEKIKPVIEEIKPREVNIYKLEVLNFDEEKQTAELLIECSKGTYIRSIANDLGGSLGCYGHLVKLVRIKAGMFNIENAFDLNELDTFEKIQSKLLTPIEYLDYPKYELNEYEKEKVSHGNPINIDDKNGLYVLIYNNSIAGIAQNSDKVARLQKVFL